MHMFITCSYIFQTNERLKKEPRQSKQRGTESFGTLPFKQRRTSKVWQYNFIIFTIVPLHHCLSVCLSFSVWFCVRSSVCPSVCHVCLISVGVLLHPFIFLIQIDVVVFVALFIYLFIYLCLCPSFTFQEKTWGEQKAHRTICERETEGLLVLYCVVYWMWEGIAQM